MFSINEKKLDQPYEEVKVNYYNYKGLKNLDNTHKININSNNFFICIYQINDSYLYPFLEFLLYARFLIRNFRHRKKISLNHLN